MLDLDRGIRSNFYNLFNVDGLFNFDDSFLNLDRLSLLFNDVKGNLLLDNSSDGDLSVLVGSGTARGDRFSNVSNGRFTMTNDSSGMTRRGRVSLVSTNSALNLETRADLSDSTRSIGWNQLNNSWILRIFSGGDLMNTMGSLTNLRLSQKSFLVELILVEDLRATDDLLRRLLHLYFLLFFSETKLCFLFTFFSVKIFFLFIFILFLMLGFPDLFFSPS